MGTPEGKKFTQEQLGLMAGRTTLFMAIDTNVGYPPTAEVWAEALGYPPEHMYVRQTVKLFTLFTERFMDQEITELRARMTNGSQRAVFTRNTSLARQVSELLLFCERDGLIEAAIRTRQDLADTLRDCV